MIIKEMTVNLVAWAKAAAVMAHESVNQPRKYGSAHYGPERYYFHPCRVSELVGTVTDDPEVIAAAALHDVLEDVSPKSPVFTPSWLLASFGPGVLGYVVECSNHYTKDPLQQRVLEEALMLLLPTAPAKIQGQQFLLQSAFQDAAIVDKATRKEFEALRYGHISPAAKIIKRADLFDNSLSLESAPADFVRQWTAEKELAERVLGSSWLEFEAEVRAAAEASVPLAFA